MENLFNDKSTYIIISKNPLKSLQTKTSEILKNLNNDKLLDNQYFNLQLTLTNTSLPKAYGLPKVHKKDYPLRPIISTINSPIHWLSKILYNSLKHCIQKPKSHIDNSFQLKLELKDVYVPIDHILISLDVTSLFTNVSKELVLKSLDRRFSQIHNNCKIPFDLVRNITSFLFDNTYFVFNGKFYKQIFGTPMGSPVSPFFADIVMDDLENDCFKILKSQYNISPCFYKRYVDDSLMIIHKDSVDTILNVFNNFDTKLSFTHEIETNKQLNFLDMTLIRSNNKILTNWFQKQTSSGRILNFNSNHHINLKKNMIYNLVDRSILLSDKKFHNNNIKRITEILINNGYDISFINKCIKFRLRKFKFNNTLHINTNNNNNISTSLTIPYINPLFNMFKNIFKNYNISIIPTYKNTLKDVIRLGKDKSNKWDTTGVVYKIGCLDCNASYVGQTKRSLKERIKEHKNNKNTESVISLHMNKFSHNFNWDKSIILDKETNYKKRLLSEMLYINSFKNTVNKIEDTEKLNHIYKSIKLL